MNSLFSKRILQTALLSIGLSNIATADTFTTTGNWESNSRAPQTYQFSVTNHSQVSILLSSNTTASQVSLLDANDNPLAQAADKGDYMYEYTLVQTLAQGDYKILITPVIGKPNGPFKLTINGSTTKPVKS